MTAIFTPPTLPVLLRVDTDVVGIPADASARSILRLKTPERRIRVLECVDTEVVVERPPAEFRVSGLDQLGRQQDPRRCGNERQRSDYVGKRQTKRGLPANRLRVERVDGRSHAAGPPPRLGLSRGPRRWARRSSSKPSTPTPYLNPTGWGVMALPHADVRARPRSRTPTSGCRCVARRGSE